MNVNEVIKTIQDFYLKYYNIKIIENDTVFLNTILQTLDNTSWKIGYQNAKEDYEIE